MQALWGLGGLGAALAALAALAASVPAALLAIPTSLGHFELAVAAAEVGLPPHLGPGHTPVQRPCYCIV